MTARESVVHSNIPNPLPSNSSFSEVLAVRGAQKYILLGSQVRREEGLKLHLSKLGECPLCISKNGEGQVETKGAAQLFLSTTGRLSKSCLFPTPKAQIIPGVQPSWCYFLVSSPQVRHQ